jgi:hypothetical protein
MKGAFSLCSNRHESSRRAPNQAARIDVEAIRSLGRHDRIAPLIVISIVTKRVFDGIREWGHLVTR